MQVAKGIIFKAKCSVPRPFNLQHMPKLNCKAEKPFSSIEELTPREAINKRSTEALDLQLSFRDTRRISQHPNNRFDLHKPLFGDDTILAAEGQRFRPHCYPDLSPVRAVEILE